MNKNFECDIQSLPKYTIHIKLFIQFHMIDEI